jgi:predicted Zn-dependent protease
VRLVIRQRSLYLFLIICFAASLNVSLFALTKDEVKEEIKLGRSIAAVIAGLYGVADNEKLVTYLNLVGQTVVLSNGRSDISYSFEILESNTLNAFGCPGGYIFVTSGLLDVLENEAELAGVLAHEIAHVNYRHVFRTLFPNRKKSVDALLSGILGAKNVSFSVAFNQFVNKGLEILLKKGLQHQDELEADVAATFYLTNSGYDNQAYKALLIKLRTTTESYSNTHPPMQDRLANVADFLDDNIPQGKRLEKRFVSRAIR